MTNDTIALRTLLEKGSDANFVREMIGFAAERLMSLRTGCETALSLNAYRHARSVDCRQRHIHLAKVIIKYTIVVIYKR
jgi:uncharacterized protein with PIN domain